MSFVRIKNVQGFIAKTEIQIRSQENIIAELNIEDKVDEYKKKRYYRRREKSSKKIW